MSKKGISSSNLYIKRTFQLNENQKIIFDNKCENDSKIFMKRIISTAQRNGYSPRQPHFFQEANKIEGNSANVI